MPLLTVELANAMVRRGNSSRREAGAPARFKPGDPVLARMMSPHGHTRIPRYIRGHRGVVDRDHGVFVFPDTNARLAGEKPQHVYSVRFSARDVWGPEGGERDSIYVDLWDDYLDPA